jgi:hypothetical protein
MRELIPVHILPMASCRLLTLPSATDGHKPDSSNPAEHGDLRSDECGPLRRGNGPPEWRVATDITRLLRDDELGDMQCRRRADSQDLTGTCRRHNSERADTMSQQNCIAW